MKDRFALLLLITICVLAFSGAAAAESWNGIVPLKTTRAEVEKLLGAPRDDRPTRSEFRYRSQRVIVDYSPGLCSETAEADWNVAKDVVISVTVSPKKPTYLEDVDINLAGFVIGLEDKKLPGMYYFLNESIGMSMNVQPAGPRGRLAVQHFFYFPTKEERRLRCPKTQK